MIRGELTNLRAVERTDAGTLHRWLNDLDGSRGWVHNAVTVSLAEIQRRIEVWLEDERTFHRPACLLFDDLDGTPVGLIALSHYEPDHRALEFALLAGEPDRWDASFEFDALESLIDTCFDRWNLHRLTARTPIVDERTVRVLERCGFRRDIVFREAAFFDGGYHDVALHCLLRTDRPLEPVTGRD